MTLGQAASKIRSYSQDTRTAFKVNMYQVSMDALNAAVYMSMGTTTSEELAAPPPGLNHPYGKGKYNQRGRRGPIPNDGKVYLINEQSGDFMSKWRVYRDSHGFDLVNTSDHAWDLEYGDKFSVRRPILEAVMSLVLFQSSYIEIAPGSGNRRGIVSYGSFRNIFDVAVNEIWKDF